MKDNKQVLEIFGQMAGTRINRLIWIAGNPEREITEDILNDMLDGESFAGCFPDIPAGIVEEYAADRELPQLLVDYDKFGFLAEVYMPDIRNMRFDKEGTPESWSVCDGCCEIGYAYAETTDDLIEKIGILDREHFNRAVKRSRG